MAILIIIIIIIIIIKTFITRKFAEAANAIKVILSIPILNF